LIPNKKEFMSWFSVDVESDGPSPMRHSMVCFGAVPVANLDSSFYGQTKPISEVWVPEALAVRGMTREQHLTFPDPAETMNRFVEWVEITNVHGRPVFVSDNPAYDWQWINGYLHYYVGRNPFGFSARRIGDMYSGLTNDATQATSWKRLRKTKHTHNPVDDAKGNAEALIAIRNMGFKVNF
jgi:hypothetical protein